MEREVQKEWISPTTKNAPCKATSDDNKENVDIAQPEFGTNQTQCKMKSCTHFEPENEDAQQKNESILELINNKSPKSTASFVAGKVDHLALAPITTTSEMHEEDNQRFRRESPESEPLANLADVSLGLYDTASLPPLHKRKADVLQTSKSWSQKARRKSHTTAKKVITHQFRFLLTGNKDECSSNSTIIAALGGRACQSGRKFDTQCTHVICSELKRTEKFVAGCAAGKWILRPSYLIASSQAGHFVDEAPHEWGAEQNSQDKVDSRIWHLAPQFWRNERAAGRPGVYNGWRFLIHPKCVPPPDMCERIVIAADGVLVPSQYKMKDLAKLGSLHTDEQPVLALLSSGLSPRDVQVKMFKTAKIKCVNAGFLIDYITKDQHHRPQYKDYLIGI